MRMYCPECGHDAATPSSAPSAAPIWLACGAPSSREGRRARHRGERSQAPPPSRARAGGRQAAPSPSGGLSPLIIWAAVAVVAVAIVVGVPSPRRATDRAARPRPGHRRAELDAGSTVTPVAADTTGSYRELVQRAHELYDEGDELFAPQQIEQGAAVLRGGRQVYEAAWQKEPGDPNVGTDWATSLFYSGDFEGAITQVNSSSKRTPTSSRAGSTSATT
jgi:hypothetical protein